MHEVRTILGRDRTGQGRIEYLVKVAASSSELGPTRAPRIKAGRLDDDNHDDEERGIEKTRFAFFSPLFSLTWPQFFLDFSFFFFFFSTKSNPTDFSIHESGEDKEKESKKTVTTTVFSSTKEGNRWVHSHENALAAELQRVCWMSFYQPCSVNPISSAAHLSLCSWLVWTKLDRYTVSQPRWPSSLPPIFRGERKNKKKKKQKMTTTKRSRLQGRSCTN